MSSGSDGGPSDYVDYCSVCHAVTPCQVIDRIDGTEYKCRVCGKRVDFDSNEDVFDSDCEDEIG